MFNIFKKKNKIKKTGKIIIKEKHKSWGDNISFLDYENGKITGHLSAIIKEKGFFRKPIIGDILRCKMESGKDCDFLITKLKWMSDPMDQFFGNIKQLGYVGEY